MSRPLLNAITRTIAEEWRHYETATMPRDACSTQVIETRRAFYAGAIAMLNMVQGVGGADVNEAAGVAYLESLRLEGLAFFDLVQKGVY